MIEHHNDGTEGRAKNGRSLVSKKLADGVVKDRSAEAS